MKSDPNYRAYLLRLWRSRDDGDCWRASLENAHTLERHVFTEMEDVFAYLQQLTLTDSQGKGRRRQPPGSLGNDALGTQGSTPGRSSLAEGEEPAESTEKALRDPS